MITFVRKSDMITKEDNIIINGNMIKKIDDLTWRVESADGSWSGYELYFTEEEAIEAAKLPSTEEDRDDRYNL